MDTKKKTLFVGIGVIVFVIAFSLFVFTDIFRGFDVQGYAEAVLNQKLKGETAGLLEFVGGTTQEDLFEQYETEITSYVDSNILSGIDVNEQQRETCVSIVKKIFSSLKYEVDEAQKVSSDVYQVSVTYRATDVISRFVTLAGEEYQRLSEKADDGGEYKGTDEEISVQMQEEFLNNACTLLEQAYKTMEFGEQQTMTFTIKKGSDGIYKIDNEEIIEFVEKITGIAE